MIKSMTGYGRAAQTIGGREITVEIRSVNNRYLDCSVKLPRVFGFAEDAVKGRVKEETGYYASRNKLQTTTLLDTLEEYKFDAAIGGARRDEEKARAKERFFSHRDEFGQWNPKNQRPELWNIFNGRKNMGEHFSVFPISS